LGTVVAPMAVIVNDANMGQIMHPWMQEVSQLGTGSRVAASHNVGRVQAVSQLSADSRVVASCNVDSQTKSSCCLFLSISSVYVHFVGVICPHGFRKL